MYKLIITTVKVVIKLDSIIPIVDASLIDVLI